MSKRTVLVVIAVVAGLLALLPLFAHAQTQCWNYEGASGVYNLSRADALARAQATHQPSQNTLYYCDNWNQRNPSTVENQTMYTCERNPSGGTGDAGIIRAQYGNCQHTPPTDCSGGGPGSPVSGSGEMSRIVNQTVGWGYVATPNGQVAIDLPAQQTACSNGCQYTANAGDWARRCYRSQERAANGLFRMSCDFVMVATGQSCTQTSTDQSNPNSAPPPCPGVRGQMQFGGRNENVCAAAPGSPPASAPTSPAPETFGNPAAGNQPSTGQGSGTGPGGRTPTTGDGGNGGGGSSSTDGTRYNGGGGSGGGGGAGSGQDPQGKDPCGLPDTPRCKLDETGTGDGQGAYSTPNSELDGIADGMKTQIEGIGGGNRITSLPWLWGFSLPVASCSAFTFTVPGHSMTVDPCTSVGVQRVRAMLGFFWAVAGALYAWRAVTDSTGGK